ncbi:VapE domain-containing protein [Lentibacillus sp. N15]|uniref:phage NrS-1 polymerase family protein n=1 Tax=Lentibacillus songyuanensis TaxID=3136161 RepID=UPI0031BA8240
MQTITEKSVIPNEIINRKQWALSHNKAPYQTNGERASSTDVSTWTSYEDAINNSNHVGYFISEHDPYTVIDLDDCIINGVITKEAKSIVESVNSYTEISQSGTGLHIFVKGNKPGNRSKNSKKGFEMYDKERFIVTTGNHLENTPLEINENQMNIDYLYSMYFPNKETEHKEHVQQSPPMSDEEILKIAHHAKNSDKFKALMNGDISAYGSHSEADQALCNMLAFYTQDAAQIERIFLDSGLYREKSDRADYMARTIEKAINDLTATYQKQDFKLHVNDSNTDTPKLILTEKDTVKKLLYNLKEILRCDPALKEIGFNEFTQEVTVNKEPITDDFIAKIRYRIDSSYLITFTKDDVIDMLGLLARERNSYHPIKEIIEDRAWDGQLRAETILIDYLGADDNDYTRSITRKWLAGAIARIYEPGIKMEIVPVLQGNQGIGKSTIAAKLGKGFFVDSLASLGNSKDDYQLLIGSWIVELSELSSVGSTKVEKMKGFISAQFDKIRLPYGRVTQNYKRTCVFIGTTNTTQFLNDLTGNRRFFPIPLKNKPTLDVFNLDDDTVQQIWAEAYQLYKNGEKLFLNENDEEVAELYRDAAMEENLFYQEIEDYLNMKVPKEWNNLSPHEKKAHFGNYRHLGKQKGTEDMDRTTAKEIAYILDLDSTNRTAQSQMKKINLYMDNLDGWEKKSVYMQGKTVKGFKKVKS